MDKLPLEGRSQGHPPPLQSACGQLPWQGEGGIELRLHLGVKFSLLDESLLLFLCVASQRLQSFILGFIVIYYGLLLFEALLAGTAGAQLAFLLLSMGFQSQKGWEGAEGLCGGGRGHSTPGDPCRAAGDQAWAPDFVPQAWTEFLCP